MVKYSVNHGEDYSVILLRLVPGLRRNSESSVMAGVRSREGIGSGEEGEPSVGEEMCKGDAMLEV